MIPAFRFELVRLGSVRSTRRLGAVAVVSSTLIALAVSLLLPQLMNAYAHRMAVVPPRLMHLAAGLLPVLPFLPVAACAGLVGFLSGASERRRGSAYVTFLAIPRRGTVLAARSLVIVGYALAVALLTMGVTTGLAAAERALRGSDGHVKHASTTSASGVTLVGALLMVVVFACYGLAIGTSVRRKPIALALLLLLPWLVEPAARVLATRISTPALLHPMLRTMPFSGAWESLALAGSASGNLALRFMNFALDAWPLLAMVTVMMLGGAVLMSRRDA